MKIAGVWLFEPVLNPHVEGLRHLAEVLCATLRDLRHGHELYNAAGKHTPTVGVEDDVWIVVGAHQDPQFLIDHSPERWIIYNTEQAGSRWDSNVYGELCSRAAAWWDHSAENAKLGRWAFPAVVVPPFGHLACDKLRGMQVDRPIDVLFAGSFNVPRVEVLDELRMRGLVVVHVFNVYGEQLTELIHLSKLCLNLHYYDSKIFESVRVQQLLAHGTAVLSETSAGDDAKAWAGAVRFEPRSKIVEAAMWMCRDGQHLTQRAAAMRFTRTMHTELAAAVAGL